MNADYFVPASITFTAAFIAALVSLYSWRRRKVRGGLFFMLLMAAVAIFAFANGAELASFSVADKLTWAKLSYLGVVSLAPLWFLFAASYGQHFRWLTPRWIALVWIIPGLTLILALTNEWHGLIWSSLTPTSPIPGAIVIYAQGSFYWVHVASAYLLMLIATIWFFKAARYSNQLLRNQVVILLVAALLPWCANFIYILRLNPWPGLDLTPLAFLITGLALFFNIIRNQMLGILPIAHDIIFNSINDGVVVVDSGDRLIDMNPTARRWLANMQITIGQNVFEISPFIKLKDKFQQPFEGSAQLEFLVDGARRVYELVISPLRNDRGQAQGRVAVLHDVSREVGLLDAAHQHARQMELLNEMTRVSLTITNLHDMLCDLVERLHDLANSDGACLALWDDRLHKTIYTTMSGCETGEFQTILPLTFASAVMAEGHFISIENTFATSYIQSSEAVNYRIRSLLAFPLISNEMKLGIAIIWFNSPHRFQESDTNLGKQAADQIALAIEKMQLFNRELQRASHLTAIQSVSQVVNSSLDLSQIFVNVVKVLQETFGYRYISIYRLEGDTLHLGAQAGYPAELILWKIPISRGILGRAVCTRTPQFVQDVSQDLDFLRASYEVDQEICVPLLKEDQILGTLNIESASPQVLTEDDFHLLITFAGQVVVAIENARLYSQVQRLAIVDDLTGLYNRRGFLEIGKREWERAFRMNRSLAILFIDVDHFKNFNDTYSYSTGDQVLKLLGSSLRTHLRDIDLVSRYGGEEFVAILPEVDITTATMVAERLRRQIEQLQISTAKGRVNLTVSIGICQKTPEILNLETLIERAGHALHIAKNNGRNCVAVSDSEI